MDLRHQIRKTLYCNKKSYGLNIYQGVRGPNDTESCRVQKKRISIMQQGRKKSSFKLVGTHNGARA